MIGSSKIGTARAEPLKCGTCPRFKWSGEEIRALLVRRRSIKVEIALIDAAFTKPGLLAARI